MKEKLPLPLFKSVGSKTQLLPKLFEYMPQEFHTYVEPMVGGGAFFWALAREGKLDGKQVMLADLNPDIVAVYEAVLNDPALLIEQLKDYAAQYLADPSKAYYDARDAYNAKKTGELIEPPPTPALLIFLRQTSFNGLWRHAKRSGKLNMAWGKFENPRIIQEDNIYAANAVLARLREESGLILLNTSIGTMMRSEIVPAPGVFTYIDPPYLETFDQFTPESMSLDQHRDLVQQCLRHASAGAEVLYSNAIVATEVVTEESSAFADAAMVMRVVHARDKINRDGAGRGLRPEMLVTFKSRANAAKVSA